MIKKEIINYQFGERIKSELIIGSKMLTVMEALEACELEGAKKTMDAFFDALAVETGMALRATGQPEFAMVEEKLKEVRRKIEEADYREAHANFGRAVSHATTACDKTMRTLIDMDL
ncbi:hypothetical protein DRN80_03655 [Methanosarcinales archaeon]|nr:MAG: hypothetical protein DRN80_03655 [Methanosarcinales archaeon]